MDVKKDKHVVSGAGAAGQKGAAEIKPADYLRIMKLHLKDGKNNEAFGVVRQAFVQFPNDPFILSYYGYLQSLVDRKYRAGVENCTKALNLVKEQDSFEKEELFAVFYLNLGRALVAAGKKKDALESFRNGLKFHKRNPEIAKELMDLGQRKLPPVSFLDRSNPINILLGKLIHSLGKGKQKA